MQTARNAVPADVSTGFGFVGSLTCAKQLDTNFFEYIDRIDNRRVWIADEETGGGGLAIGFSHFRHPMTKKVFALYGVPGQETRDMSTQKSFELPAARVQDLGWADS